MTRRVPVKTTNDFNALYITDVTLPTRIDCNVTMHWQQLALQCGRRCSTMIFATRRVSVNLTAQRTAQERAEDQWYTGHQ